MPLRTTPGTTTTCANCARCRTDELGSHYTGTPPRSRRERSGKAPGGQPGHRGHTLALTATPDRVVAHHPGQCARCGTALADLPAVAVVRRQVVDLPPPALAVTEHRAAVVRCPRRRGRTTAGFPPTVARPVQYGPRLLGPGVYLRHYQLLPYQRIAEVLADRFGAGPSAGTLHAASVTCAAALAGVAGAIKAALQAAPLAHADETSIRVAGQRHRVHVVSTATLTHDARHAKRGHAATEAIGLLPGFVGRLIHDGRASSWRHPGPHGRCNAHHLRELAAVAEPPGQAGAEDLRALLVALKRRSDQARAAGHPGHPTADTAADAAR